MMALDRRNLYRLPWSMNDNPVAWVEVTDRCNIHCDGCYRHQLTGHKPLDRVKEEILLLKEWRNPDNVSLAGGEPLIHPQIREIVSFIAELGLKPIIMTNALALTPELLHGLKEAGAAGFTIHVDSRQSRPHWSGKTESELNELRQKYADMIAAEGGIYAIFNLTVYPSTLHEIPGVVRWAHANMGRVHGLDFITYRTTSIADHLAYDPAGREIDLRRLGWTSERPTEKPVTAVDIHRVIRESFLEYDASCYLGGSFLPTSYKWLIGAVIGSRHRVYGSVGRQTMERIQADHHARNGTYLAYSSSPWEGAKVLLFSVRDPAVRRAARNWLKDLLRHPNRLFSELCLQGIAIIQPPDLLPDGRIDMCDGCPDMAIYEGKLIQSCRMDEYRLYGGFTTVRPRSPGEASARSMGRAEAVS